MSHGERVRLSVAEAETASILARRRQSINHGGWRIEVVPAPPPARDAVELPFLIAGEPAIANVPRDLHDAVLGQLDPAALSAPADVAPLLAMLALAGPLDRLEAACPALTVACSAAADQIAALPCALGLACQIGAAAGTLRIDLPWRAAALIADMARAITPIRRRLPDLTVPLHVRALVTTLPVAALRGVVQGDVILADRAGPDEVILVAGERLAWRAARQGGTLQLASGRLCARAAGLGDWVMDEPPPLIEDGGIGDLPIRLAFELGRLEIALSELETLGPGHVFQLGGDEDQPVDIVANGRRIGRGRIVTVGQEVGVQVVWIGRHE